MLKITFSKSRGLENKLGQVIKINSNVGSISAAELQRLNEESKTAAAQSLASSQQSAQSAIDAQTAAAQSLASSQQSAQSAIDAQNSAANAQDSSVEALTSSQHSAQSAIDAQNSATQSLASSQQSAQSAIDAQNSAEEAASWADVAGANFQAMNAAQFNAIRARNNEEFAASGFVHLGKHHVSSGSSDHVNQGLSTWGDTPALANRVAIGKKGTLTGTSKTDYAVVNMAGVIFDIDGLNLDQYIANNYAYIKFPEAPDGKTTYNKSTGAVTTYDHAYQAFAAAEADPTNIEVVTDRVDMWGFEAWLEEVTYNNPFVYPNGLIQSQATTMNGVSTAASNRPVSYYAVFDGDTSSKGKGVNFFNQTAEDRKKILADPKNNLFFGEDGKLYQWRLRQRTIAGAGNGDWLVIDSASKNSTAGSYLRFSDKTKVGAQGVMDTVKVPSGGVIHYVSSISTYNTNSTKNDPAIFYARDVEGPFSANGECYFLVCGTVNRLNQGAYHPSFNSSGTRKWQHISGDTSQFWYEPSAPTGLVQSDCFRDATSSNGSEGKGYRNNTGYIGGAGSGRPDGRFYDAIYADGQGGVCRDMRYSAYGVTEVDFAEADLKVKNGTYRGFEKVKKSIIANTTIIQTPFDATLKGVSCKVYRTNLTFSQYGMIPVTLDKFNVNDSCALKYEGVTYIGSVLSGNGINIDFVWVKSKGANPPISNADSVIALFTSESMSSSVGGSFLQTDVIGDPANILQVDALKNGWEGSWIPIIPDSTNKKFLLKRKMVSHVGTVYTLDDGVSWITTYTPPISTATNSFFNTMASNTVLVTQYQAFSKQTEPANNEVVYGGNKGIGAVFISSDYFLYEHRGTLLKESLTGGLRGHTPYSKGAIQEMQLTQSGFIGATPLLSSSRQSFTPKHGPLDIDGSTAADGFKALDYNVNINQQAFKQYAATELKHDGTDWGDDSKIHIVDGESTMTDLNGNVVKVVTHRLREPIGWIKNKV